MAHTPRHYVSIAVLLFAMAVFAVGCSSVRYTSSNSGSGEKEGATLPAYQDEYAELDDASSSSSINDRLVTGKLESARQKYLRALTLIDRGDTTNAAHAFEEAIEVLNAIVNYPNIEDNPEFADLMQSIIEDYESYIQSIDNLSENSSIAVLRDKFFQEVDSYSTDPNANDAKNSVGVIKVPTAGVPPAFTAVQGELQIDMPDNEYVRNCITFFTSTKGKKFFNKWLPRAGRWFPMMRKIAKEEGVPEELIYLSIVESGLDPNAVSPAKAVGLWQFIKSTGEMYSLDANYWIDERRDPEKATRAAMRHLKDLYNEFGNWHLALAAYNCGMGGVRRTIARSGKTDPDYWEIRDFLPRETRGYVPLFIAAAKISMNPEQYGFTDVSFEDAFDYETVPVSESVDLRALAKCANTSIEEIKALNPELVQGCTPPNTQNYELKLPRGTKDAFVYNFSQLPDSEKRSWVYHKVRKKETLVDIAEQYGSSVDLIADANNLSGTRKRLRAGTMIRVPVGAAVEAEAQSALADARTSQETKTAPDAVVPTPRRSEPTTVAAKAEERTEPASSSKKVYHQVRRNETLHSIANRYGVRIADLRNWNNIPYDSDNIQANTNLVVYLGKDNASQLASSEPVEQRTAQTGERQTATATKHKVRRGETVATIADDYGVSINDIRKSNNLNSRSKIRVGQTLKIPANGSRQETAIASARQQTQTRGKNLVTHRVRRGETLNGIASIYGVDERDIARWNPGDIKGNTVYHGTRLKIYSDNVAKGSSTPSGREGRAPKTYKIRKGDTLGSIAGKFGVSIARLKKLNKSLNERNLQVGTSLRLQ